MSATEPQLDLDCSDATTLLRLLDAAVDALIVLDGSGLISWVSPSTEELLGRSAEELLGTDPLDLVVPEERAAAAAKLLTVIGDAEADPPPVVRLAGADGTKWIEVTAEDLRSCPAVAGIVLSGRDMGSRIEQHCLLSETERRFGAMVRHSADALAMLDRLMRIEYISPSIEQLSGIPAERLLGLDPLDVVLEPDRSELAELLQQVLERPGASDSIRVRLPKRSGGSWWAEVRVVNRFDDPSVGSMIANLRDVTDKVAHEVAARQLTEIFDLTEDLVWVVDRHSRLQYMNPACQRFVGLEDAELEAAIGEVWKIDGLGLDDGDLLGGSHRLTKESSLVGADGRALPFRIQVIGHTDGQDEISRYSVIAHDISESRRLASRLEHQAMHDPLTGLPNRSLLERRMRVLRSAGAEMAVLFIDLDHFKVINDSLGHAFGDRVLVAVARRLRHIVRGKDVVARFGGDEFVVLSDGISGSLGATEIANRIVDSLLEPFVIDGVPVHVGVSIGIAERTGPSEDDDPAALIRDADTAMYNAKSSGRGRIVLFDEDLRHRAVERQRIEAALRCAPIDDTLSIEYQPQVETSTLRLTGLEALVRWRHDGRVLPPNEFIPIAEETDLIVPVGEWVLEQACADLARWRTLPGWEHLGVSVNVSVRQLQSPSFTQVVAATLARHGLSSSALTLEVTESVMLDDAAVGEAGIWSLAAMGIRLAIDDFGTGYSSLTCMTRLPLDVVKLDCSLLTTPAIGSEDALIAAVLDMVAALGLSCVAEGVETEHQLAQLSRLGCAAAQGFLIARPQPAAQITAALAQLTPEDSWSHPMRLG